MNDRQKLSRREVIKMAALATVAPFMAAVVDQAHAAKATKAQMQYRDKPNGKQECSNCIQFVPGKSATANGTCKVVEGSISPHGWCIAYSPKA